MQPKISLVVPIYNTAQFLDYSIPSVLAQQYPNLEIVLLNNGSTDNSQEIIDKYAQMDSRIITKTINHVNTVKESRDNAISFATADWIIPIDSDDAIEPEYVNKLWKRHEETEADFVGAIMAFKSADGTIRSTVPVKEFDLSVVYSGIEAMIHTMPGGAHWEFGCNGCLWRKTTWTNLSTQPNAEIYTDECDYRIYLRNCNIVAFTDAMYYVSYNPNSTGRKPSITRLTYGLATDTGIHHILSRSYGAKTAITLFYKGQLTYYLPRVLIQLIKQRSFYKSQMNDWTRDIINESYEIINKDVNTRFAQFQIKSIGILYKLYSYLYA